MAKRRTKPSRPRIDDPDYHRFDLVAGPDPAAATAETLARIRAEEIDLQGRIEAINEMLAEAPERHRRQKLARRDLIPPPEGSTLEPWRAAPKAYAGPNRRRLTRAEQKQVAREKWGHVLWSLFFALILLGMLTALARMLQS